MKRWLIAIVMVAVVGMNTVTVNTSVALAPAARSPTVHSPKGSPSESSNSSYVPWETTGAPIRPTPAGRMSTTTTPVASAGPLLVTVTVYTMVSP